MTKLGINDHFLMWAPRSDYPIPQLTKLGVKVCRNDLIADPVGGGYCGQFGTAQCVKTVAGWAEDLRAAGIQPLIVVTFASLPPTARMAKAVRALVTGVRGLWIEWGNEIHYQAPVITAAEYVEQFGHIVHAVHAADPTAKIGPAPVGNINPGGDGWVLTEQMFAAGLRKVPYDFLSFHLYPWPTYEPPSNALAWLPGWKAQCASWFHGNPKPLWLTEWGWQWNDDNGAFTDEDQATCCRAFWQSPEIQALPVAVAYSLGDSGGQAYGWMASSDTSWWAEPRDVYTVFEGAAAAVSAWSIASACAASFCWRLKL